MVAASTGGQGKMLGLLKLAKIEYGNKLKYPRQFFSNVVPMLKLPIICLLAAMFLFRFGRKSTGGLAPHISYTLILVFPSCTTGNFLEAKKGRNHGRSYGMPQCDHYL